MKPFSQACENNRQPILQVLQKELATFSSLLEIGSGTGQHAVYLAKNLSHLIWQTSDVLENHSGINSWIDEEEAPNLKRPIRFRVGVDNWPTGSFDCVFSANTAHIMQVHEVELMMSLIDQALPAGGRFCQYGPFNINGQYTSESNKHFDAHLANQGCGGIRSIEELVSWSGSLTLVKQIPMPANNQILVWEKG